MNDRRFELRRLTKGKPYWRLLGVTGEEISDGYARLRMPLAPKLRNSRTGPAHGGALASLVDMAIGLALDSLALPDMEARATIDLNVTYFEATEGEFVVAEARMLRVGRGVGVGEAEVRDGDGRLVAKGRATYKISRRPTPPS
jgi:acyl-CoA thioesterase